MMMKEKGIAGVMRLAWCPAVTTPVAGSATLSEMRMLNARQLPGMTVTCREFMDIPLKGQAEPVRVESVLTGVVLQNDGDRIVSDVTYTQTNAGWQAPFRTETYRLTTTLEATRQKLAVYPETLSISLPYARDREAYFLGLLKASTVSYDDYSTYRVMSATDYQILPGPASPDAPVMHCKVHTASG
ncbi:TPA: hypothetical protein N3A31_004010 [Salmonella enterica subsp. houtenae serovar 43:z4,z32:-]|nr:hypothetical protein [Salmonella enterica subsp. houtenae serovar 43:z4,z32:-]